MSTQTLAGNVSEQTSFPMGVECRISERHNCGLAASCQPVAARGDNDLSWPAEIRDISAGGCGVVLGRRFERGAGLAIEIPETPTASADTLLARVVHTTALPEGEWLLGCSFISELSDDELDRLLTLARSLRTTPSQWDTTLEDAPAPISGRDDPATEASYTLQEVTWQGTHDGQTGRCHAPRLRLKGSWPLLPGTILRIWFGKKPHVRVRLKVIDCVKWDGRWAVEYAFIDPPPGDLRQALGF